MHARAVCIEDACDLDLAAMHASIVEHQRFCRPLALIITGARPCRTDMAGICLGLRVHLGIAIDFACGRLEDAGRFLPCQLEQVQRPKNAGFHRADRILLIMRRRGRAGEIVDPVERPLDAKWFPYIMFDEAEVWMIQQGADVPHGSSVKIVQADDAVSPPEERVANMRTDEAGAPGNQSTIRTACVDRGLNGHDSPSLSSTAFLGACADA